MRRGNKITIGVSITEEFIRLVKVKTDGKAITICRLGEFHLSESSNFNSKSLKSISEIKKYIKENSLRGAGLISPDDREVILKDRTLPPVKKQEIFKLIESEIKDYAIFNHENVSLGFSIINKEKDKVSIIWAGLKESLLMQTLSFVKHIGIKPIAVVPSNFAIAKFIQYFYPSSKNFVIISVDKSMTTLTFVNDGRVVLNYKHDVGLGDIEDGALNVVNNWVGTILTTITFVSRNRKISVEKIFLITQYGDPEKLIPFLSSRIPHPIVLPDVKSLMNFEDEEDFLKIQKTGGYEYIIPIGLALLQASGINDPLFCDISKHILVEKASVRLKIFITTLLLIVMNGAAIYLYPIFSSTLSDLNSNLRYTDERIRIVSKEVQNTEKIKKDISNLNNILGQYESAYAKLKVKPVSSSLLRELKLKLPKDTFLSSVTIDVNGKILISGTGRSYKDVLDYEVNLSEAQFVNDPYIVEMSQNTSGIVIFKMIAQSNGVKNEKGK